MKKQKWMMMGVTAVVSSALFVPGAFAKPKDDGYVAPAAVTAPASQGTVDAPYKAPVYGPAQFFAPPENPNSKRD